MSSVKRLKSIVDLFITIGRNTSCLFVGGAAVRQQPQLYLIWSNCDMTSSGFVPNDGFPLENTPWLVSKCSTSVNDLHFIKQKPEKSLKHHSCLQKIQVAGIATTSRHIPNHSIVKHPLGNEYLTRYWSQMFSKKTCIFVQPDMWSSKVVCLDVN